MFITEGWNAFRVRYYGDNREEPLFIVNKHAADKARERGLLPPETSDEDAVEILVLCLIIYEFRGVTKINESSYAVKVISLDSGCYYLVYGQEFEDGQDKIYIRTVWTEEIFLEKMRKVCNGKNQLHLAEY